MTDNSNANSFWAERAYWLSKCAAASERNRSDQTGTQVPEVAKFHGFDYGISYETQINRNLHSTVSERVRAAPRAVLSAQQAIEIYSQRPVSGTGGWRTLIVAERFGVSPKTVRDIWNRRSWAPETRHLWAPGEFAAEAAAFAVADAAAFAAALAGDAGEVRTKIINFGLGLLDE